MKISYNWLKQFVQIDKTPQELSLILTNVGLEVESVEKVQPVVGGLEGLVIGEVLTCVQHPNADRLRITTVNVGGKESLQIVCGAPNVAAGQKVVVATVGTTVYPLEGEPFKIKESKIRGELSQGMICAEDEIGLGKSHDGIMVLADDTEVGIRAKDHFKMEDDYVFEIGLTPNRADAASHLGVARDLAAYFRSEYEIPDLSAFKTDNENLVIKVEVEDLAACPRYSSLTISGVTVQESPEWLKDKLKVIGLRPINNVVDITNYVLHGLGQPLHAFDADKITGGKVVVKKVAEGTPFVTLDDVERKLSAEDLMICNAEAPMCIAGVFGGKSSGVESSTKNIFLESAYFNSVSVRKTSKRHGLKTDASFRFERGTDPEITVTALKYAALLIKELAGGEISSSVSDIYPNHIKPFEFEVSYTNINKLIGANIPSAEIKHIITALGISATNTSEDTLALRVPSFKVDVTRECDITEEVLRIYGYNNIEIPAKVNASLSYSIKPEKENTHNVIADMLTSNGYAEIMCNSLTKSAYSKKLDEAVFILNPLSSDLNVMRQSLLMPALESVAYNQNRKNSDVKFYEFGKTYHLINEKYVERPRLLLLISGAKQSEQWNHNAKAVTFYNLKSAVDAIISRLGIESYQSDTLSDENFAYGIRYFRGDKTLVSFGAVSKADRKAAGVNAEAFYADFDWATLLDIVKKNKIVNKEIAKYPAVRRDLSLLIDQSVSFDTLKGIAFKTDKKLIKEVGVFDVYVGDKLPEGKKSYALNFILQDEEQTLTDKQIDHTMQKLIANLTGQAGAEIRK
ncbi:phenylalanine--tRNA ligase subunit beta [Pedobacter zeae]|uniref:Phenylalanine--tRNA ligase beta subunit n=1 Tax=Pedobacter zeae TaxID=1737356 RepID=A0A7W6P5L9_9SPHI|nr:phenylalanine--tRNA ligase subunit beta [Pedobacter zeae]MBB4107963.1 phenylalanyl-tRNA synthetase beta chain [Pedobacter zeae]GGG95915.1 phenylalanine--tRNA ligase beta subunit [Pedobacter zeae]